MTYHEPRRCPVRSPRFFWTVGRGAEGLNGPSKVREGRGTLLRLWAFVPDSRLRTKKKRNMGDSYKPSVRIRGRTELYKAVEKGRKPKKKKVHVAGNRGGVGPI